jgi:predicted RNA binding protein YcfA (HicA-like mRNA interferase family)
VQDFRAERLSANQTRGSHIIMQKKTGDTTITIPVPNHNEIKVGTLQSIIRQSKLSRELFEV